VYAIILKNQKSTLNSAYSWWLYLSFSMKHNSFVYG